MRRGFTLTEVLVVIVVVGLLTGLAIPPVAKWRDRWAVRRAGNEATLFYQRVRFTAVLKSATMRIGFRPELFTAVSESPSVNVSVSTPGPARHGVHLEVSRSVIRLYPDGTGLGPANTKLVFRRGSAAESLTVSRLGRLKRWP